MISTTDFRKGLPIKVEGQVYYIVDFQHGRTAQRRAQVKTKLKNIKTGQFLEMTFSAGEVFDEPDFNKLTVEFLYKAGQEYNFMDNKSYEQIALNEDFLSDAKWFLVEGKEYTLLVAEGSPLGLELPASMVLKVTFTEPAVKGDTVNNITKPATLETGLEVKVPMFVKEGDSVKVNTTTHEYVERLQNPSK